MGALKDCDAVRHADAIRRKYGLDEQNRQRRIYWGPGR